MEYEAPEIIKRIMFILYTLYLGLFLKLYFDIKVPILSLFISNDTLIIIFLVISFLTGFAYLIFAYFFIYEDTRRDYVLFFINLVLVMLPVVTYMLKVITIEDVIKLRDIVEGFICGLFRTS